MKSSEFRKLFPLLGSLEVIYFDNAATSQRPQSVIDAITDGYSLHNANIHRAVHTLSAEATDAFEAGRDAAAKFINAPSREEVIFTSGTTAGINLVAQSFCERFLQEGDEIIIGEAEHHSNIVPWQMAALRHGAKVVPLRSTADGPYDPEELKRLITPRTRIVALGHASNILGIENHVRLYADICHAAGVPLLVDGAQGAAHCRVDVQAFDCDFYAFSLHKVYGPTGVGVLFGKKKWLEQMPPYMGGGEMVDTVTLEKTTYAPLPHRFEAGTQNFIGAAASRPALELASAVLSDTELLGEFAATCAWLRSALLEIDGLTLYDGGVCRSEDGADSTANYVLTCADSDTAQIQPIASGKEHAHEGVAVRNVFGNHLGGYDGVAVPGAAPMGVFAFSIAGVHHEDLAILLDKMGVAVRSGQMCAEPLMRHFGVTGMLRASLLPYNTPEEAEIFIRNLRRAIDMLR